MANIGYCCPVMAKPSVTYPSLQPTMPTPDSVDDAGLGVTFDIYSQHFPIPGCFQLQRTPASMHTTMDSMSSPSWIQFFAANPALQHAFSDHSNVSSYDYSINTSKEAQDGHLLPKQNLNLDEHETADIRVESTIANQSHSAVHSKINAAWPPTPTLQQPTLDGGLSGLSLPENTISPCQTLNQPEDFRNSNWTLEVSRVSGPHTVQQSFNEDQLFGGTSQYDLPFNDDQHSTTTNSNKIQVHPLTNPQSPQYMLDPQVSWQENQPDDAGVTLNVGSHLQDNCQPDSNIPSQSLIELLHSWDSFKDKSSSINNLNNDLSPVLQGRQFVYDQFPIGYSNIPALGSSSSSLSLYNYPQSVSSELSPAADHSPSSHANHQLAVKKADKIQFILDQRKKGKSYRAIKELGSFAEAESTLRGMVRNTTKGKNERPRKPVWTERDVGILKETVSNFIAASSGRRSTRNQGIAAVNLRARERTLQKLPWKQIAEAMANRGCHLYGNATVKKKYIEVMGYTPMRQAEATTSVQVEADDSLPMSPTGLDT